MVGFSYKKMDRINRIFQDLQDKPNFIVGLN